MSKAFLFWIVLFIIFDFGARKENPRNKKKQLFSRSLLSKNTFLNFLISNLYLASATRSTVDILIRNYKATELLLHCENSS